MAIIRPRNSGAVVNCISELETGQNPPMLVDPTRATRMQLTQNQGDHAIAIRPRQQTVISAYINRPLCLRSLQLATTMEPKNAPAPRHIISTPVCTGLSFRNSWAKPVITCM